MAAVVVDTHVAIWYFSSPDLLSQRALGALDEAVETGDRIYLASISVVEVVYLVEKGRLPATALSRLHDLLAASDSPVLVYPLDLAVAQTLQTIPRASVPDMPDRIVAATALHLGLPLVTRDIKIRASSIPTIW